MKTNTLSKVTRLMFVLRLLTFVLDTKTVQMLTVLKTNKGCQNKCVTKFQSVILVE